MLLYHLLQAGDSTHFVDSIPWKLLLIVHLNHVVKFGGHLQGTSTVMLYLTTPKYGHR